MAKERQGEAAVPEATAPADVPLIIEKYLQKRTDLEPSIMRVLAILYRGETHTSAEWADIIRDRLTRSAD